MYLCSGTQGGGVDGVTIPSGNLTPRSLFHSSSSTPRITAEVHIQNYSYHGLAQSVCPSARIASTPLPCSGLGTASKLPIPTAEQTFG